MSTNNIATLRAAAVTESKGTGAMVAYARALTGMASDTKALDREIAQFIVDGGSKSYASAIKRIALGKADGDASATNVLDVAYASTSNNQKAAGKTPQPKVTTAKEVVAAFQRLSKSEVTRALRAIAATHADEMKAALKDA